MFRGYIICAILATVNSYPDHRDRKYADSPDSYELTHTAVQKVPAVLGESVQLRCSRIIQITTFNHLYCSGSRRYGSDSDRNDHGCKYKWERKGKVINETDGKYEFSDLTTTGYCEIIPGATDLLSEGMKISTTEYEDSDYYKNEHYRDSVFYKQRCYTSILTIHKVDIHDLGYYRCSFIGEYNDKDALTLSLYGTEQPTKIVYFGKSVLGTRSIILMQCVVQNGDVNWFVSSNETNESQLSKLPIEEMDKFNGWGLCSNYSTASHKVGDITESFLYFDHVCGLDDFLIHCGADTEGNIVSKGRPLRIIPNGADIQFYSYWTPDDPLYANTGIVLPTVIIVFFAIAGGIACFRGKTCASRCCDSRNLCACCGAGSAPTPRQTPVVYTTASNAVYPVSNPLLTPAVATPRNPPAYTSSN